VGDIESMPFIEALRQLQYKIGKSNMFMVQVSPIYRGSSATAVQNRQIQHIHGPGESPNQKPNAYPQPPVLSSRILYPWQQHVHSPGAHLKPQALPKSAALAPQHWISEPQALDSKLYTNDLLKFSILRPREHQREPQNLWDHIADA